MQIENEKLSKLMDGQDLSADALADVARDEQARATWARYHLIGDVLRDGLGDVAPNTFAASLADKIDLEPTVLAPQKSKRTLAGPVAGFAIAASVATLAVIGLQQTDIPAKQIDAAPALAELAAENAPLVAANVAPTPVVADTMPPRLPIQEPTLHSQPNLNKYLVKFNTQRRSVGIPSVNPHVRIVGYEPE